MQLAQRALEAVPRVEVALADVGLLVFQSKSEKMHAVAQRLMAAVPPHLQHRCLAILEHLSKRVGALLFYELVMLVRSELAAASQWLDQGSLELSVALPLVVGPTPLSSTS